MQDGSWVRICWQKPDGTVVPSPVVGEAYDVGLEDGKYLFKIKFGPDGVCQVSRPDFIARVEHNSSGELYAIAGPSDQTLFIDNPFGGYVIVSPEQFFKTVVQDSKPAQKTGTSLLDAMVKSWSSSKTTPITLFPGQPGWVDSATGKFTPKPLSSAELPAENKLFVRWSGLQEPYKLATVVAESARYDEGQLVTSELTITNINWDVYNSMVQSGHIDDPSGKGEKLICVFGGMISWPKKAEIATSLEHPIFLRCRLHSGGVVDEYGQVQLTAEYINDGL